MLISGRVDVIPMCPAAKTRSLNSGNVSSRLHGSPSPFHKFVENTQFVGLNPNDPNLQQFGIKNQQYSVSKNQKEEK